MVSTSHHRPTDDPQGHAFARFGGSRPERNEGPETAVDTRSGGFADEIAGQLGLPRIALSDLLAAEPLVDHFSWRFLRETVVFPFQSARYGRCLAVADPRDTASARAAELVFGGPVALVVASAEDISTALSRLADDDHGEGRTEAPQPQLREDDIEGLRDLAAGAPVVRAVNDLLEQAVELRASDIHVEAMRSGLSIRMRVDGLLKQLPAPAGVLPQAVISRIKIVAGLNIAERRLPQDGAARLQVGRSELDVRVAVMPTQHGESAVIRLLPRDRGLLSIEKLGFSAHDDRSLRRLLALPHGMIVICGPTGSGKTTTLATALSVLNEPTRKILTIEDPVEYELPGINQSQVKPAIGLTFASALRSFVRQDPDVIMVGEVRDGETAHVAVHAALTGHLVLTTLHTENAAAAVPRLLDLGVEDFLLRSTLRAVIAQRLVRRLCDRCRAKRTLSAGDLNADPRYAAVGFDIGETVYEPVGCDSCGGAGYRGRLGIFEVLELDPEIRSLIQGSTDASAIDRTAIRRGMTTMLDDGAAKCRAGATSVAEVLRVTTLR
ncbi:General secretion pathway protein E [Bradyrhizobium sp. ORS 285]|uniref:GspE/PulE family protein n=1 Tax=Bradyrhizobium sp. ORS 285 TaxID=115808 RepID=UPI00024073B7|nr:ATPase, T2SS/T4P/T4SS family [Bradyrhizobium sp. ORS 285]CCD89604.1 putative General secretion pathway protein E (Type II traffic warden ATPase) [Bradyrhizobium sp. ORS 285]SMX56283.1 General secretion pathway protein E [Bradyrhizobium sp. ORS 285]